MYYQNTVAEIRSAIEAYAPGTKAEFHSLEKSSGPAPLSYLLWMCDEIEKMDDPEKAGRWIGWVCRDIERHSGFPDWNNQKSRDFIRADVEARRAPQ